MVVGLLAAGVGATPGGAASPALQVPRLRWVGCGAPYQCATATVPLDYDDPSGPTISIALARLPASNPARRIGSMFVNPGGPGGSGVGLIKAGAAEVIWTPEVRARFDIIGFDPRGIGASTPVKCFRSNDELNDLLAGVPIFPFKAGQMGPYANAFARYGQSCLRNAGAILRHMSTANVARDLDLLRQAVGDRGLTYDGVSYGSFLGSVYANMFPTKVRALIVDGVLDPVAWTTGRPPSGSSVPFSTRLGSAHGADDTFHQFLQQCDAAGRPTCAFAPGAAAKFARLDARARTRSVVDSEGFVYTYDVFNSALLGSIYDVSGWEGMAFALQDIYDATFAPSASAAGATKTRKVFAYDNGFDAFLSVVCSDSLNPRDPYRWIPAAQEQARSAPLFAYNWSFASEPCSTWPVTDEDHYLGPFDRTTAAPVLVIGNLHDPATPYHGAQAVAGLLPRSRLLTLDVSGHTAWAQSRCIDDHVARYLVDGTLPPVGTTCAADVHPFASTSGAVRAARAAATGARPVWSFSR
jgi:pimeloyl-ACP methyl ester carboxylesterase